MATEPSVLIRNAPALAGTESGTSPWSEAAPRTLVSRAKHLRDRLGTKLNLAGLEYRDFTVISNDCWGQALYEELGLPNRTPMVGSGMHAACFLQFLTDIPGYLASPLRFIETSRHESVNRLRVRRGRWPMALLGDDVEVHFLHYHSEHESRSAWEAGCRQVNLNRMVVKFTIDKDGAQPEHAAIFNKMPFERKLLLSAHRHPGLDCAVQVPNYVVNGAVMFRRSLRHFDCAHWLNTGEILRFTPRVLANKAIYARGV